MCGQREVSNEQEICNFKHDHFVLRNLPKRTRKGPKKKKKKRKENRRALALMIFLRELHPILNMRSF